jgi:hypothetical protein
LEPISATPKDDQYSAAVREAHELVQRDEFPFRLDEPGRPEALAQWAMRYAVERTTHPLKFCPHPGEAQVRYIFGCEPNHSYCAACAKRRHGQLKRDARVRRLRECDFCHQDETVVELSFAVAAVIVRTYICRACVISPNIKSAR